MLLLDDAPDRDTDVAAAEAGVAEYVTDPKALERALRYAITHQHALARLAESEQRHALAMQGANDGLWDWDVRRDRLYFSPRWKQMLGYSEPELGDAPGEWLGRVHPDDRAALTQALEAHLSGASQHFEHEHRVQHRDGSYRWVLARGMAVRDAHGRATRVVGSQTDVTDRKQAEQRLQHDALHDALTGLPNRVLFLDRLDQAIRRAQRAHPTAAAAVLFLDLDRFKLVNDSLGHAVGDQLLIAVARRLESAVRPAGHRRPPRRRRVHGPARRRDRRARGVGGRRARPRDPAHPVRHRRARAVHRRVDRHRAGATPTRRRTRCCATPTSPCTEPRRTARDATRYSTRACTSR